MITTALMGVVNWVIQLLPEWEPLGWLPDVIGDLGEVPVIGQALGIILWADHYFPVNEFFGLLAITGTLLAAGGLYTGVMWLWRNLPGKAT